MSGPYVHRYNTRFSSPWNFSLKFLDYKRVYTTNQIGYRPVKKGTRPTREEKYLNFPVCAACYFSAFQFYGMLLRYSLLDKQRLEVAILNAAISMKFSTCSIATFKKEIDTTKKITKKPRPYRSVVGRGYSRVRRWKASGSVINTCCISVRRGVPKSSRYKLANDWSSAWNSTPLKSHLNLYSHTHLSISSTSSYPLISPLHIFDIFTW